MCNLFQLLCQNPELGEQKHSNITIFTKKISLSCTRILSKYRTKHTDTAHRYETYTQGNVYMRTYSVDVQADNKARKVSVGFVLAPYNPQFI